MSTYASGDAGIQGESQREITASRKKLSGSGWPNSKKIQENLSINLPLEFR
jgi:hypothetical protein